MDGLIFDIQRFAKVIAGKTADDNLAVTEDKTQVYGLAGDDTLESNGKSDVLLIGGSGNDVLSMTGGNGTLSGGAGKDIFCIDYSADKTVSAVIEDIDPTNDKIVITYNGNDSAQLNQMISGDDVVWTDDKGCFNLTLKGSNDASDYYEGTAHEYIWDILELVNQEREDRNLSPLTMAQELTDGAAIRSEEIIESYEHVRPDGTSCFTVLKKSYSHLGENIAVGQTSPENVMIDWMNSSGHRANILNENYKKLGVGYTYDSNSEWKHHWVQMFGGTLSEVETISTSEILNTSMTLNGKKVTVDTGNADAETITNDNSDVNINGGDGSDSITNNGDNVTINAGKGHDRIFNYGNNVSVYVESGNNLIVNGEFFNKGGINIKINGGVGNDTITNSGSNSVLDGGAGADLIYNGYYYYESWNYFYDHSYNNGQYNDAQGSSQTTITGGAGNDSIDNLGSNVTIEGGTGDDFIKNAGDNVLFRYNTGDGNDYIIGFNETNTLSIADSSYSTEKSYNDIIVTVGEGKIVLSNAATLSALNISTATDTTTTSTLLTVTNSTKSPVTVGSDVKVINASKRTKAVKITGNKLANTITGGSKNDTINGGKGNDSILGGKGNDKLYGGDGKDSLWGDTGNDKIYGQAGNDKLYGGDGKDSLWGDTGNDKLYGQAGNDKLYGGDGKDSLWGDTGNDKLYGQAGNDKLYGGDGKDTLWGGKGNDSLWGDAGADKFIYDKGDGKDVIYGFDNSDMLKITGKFSASYNESKEEIYFKVGSTSKAITLKDFTATTFNVNGTSYEISGSKLVKK